MDISITHQSPNCICSICEKEFYKRPDKIKNSKQHFCSRECIKNNSKTQVLVECLNCKKEFYKKNNYIKKSPNHFCSRNCSASFNNLGVRRHAGELPKCIVCDEEVRNSYKKYCSTKCSENHFLKNQFEKFKNGEIPSQSTTKKYLILQNGHKCSICKLEEWCGQKIPLVMDHIDGNAENNLPENLRLVCGNCDMQLPTYKSKNKGNGRAFRRLRYIEGKSY
jgi:hypothetical protein